MKTYIIRIQMSSSGRIDNSKDLTDRVREIEYRYDKETRNKIGAIRTNCFQRASKYVFDFYGLHLIREDSLNAIENIVSIASRDMQLVAPELSANITIIPIDANAIKQGEVYQEINNALRAKVQEIAIERIKLLLTRNKIDNRNVNSLVRAIDGVRLLNVFADEDVEKDISGIINYIQDSIKVTSEPIVQEIEAAIDAIESRFANIEL